MTRPDARLELDMISLRGWLAALVLVASLHVGGVALALMQWPEEDLSYDSAGVVTVELAPLATSVAEDNPDIAPGPNMQEAPNTPEASKKVDEKPEEVVEMEKAPPAPEPEVALPVKQPKPEKKEEKPEEQAQQEVKTQASVGDPITAAPAKTEAPVAATTAAPVAGTGRTAELAQATWQKSLLTHLNTNKRYPVQARARGDQGTAKVQFRIDRRGNVIASELLASSGSPSLDEEALAVLKRASPLPAPPAEFGGETIALTLPIQFRIK